MLGEHSKGSKPFQGRFLAGAFSKYDEPSLPPIWKTMEVVSFGTLSKLYCNFSDVDVKKAVAHSFGLPQYLYLETWTKCIAVLRNLCAHHPKSDFKEKVIALLYDKSQTITKAMGFPANWQEEPLWKE